MNPRNQQMIKRKLVIVIAENMEFTLDNIEALQDLRDEFIEAVQRLKSSSADSADEVFIECTVLKDFLHSMVESIKKDAEERKQRERESGEGWKGGTFE